MARPALEVPAWEPAVTAELERAQRSILLIGRATPVNLATELARLEEAFARDDACAPRFEYDRAPRSSLEGELHALADQLDSLGETLALAYAGRARELALEQALCTSVGRPEFWMNARARFTQTGSFAARADALAEAWLAQSIGVEDDTVGPTTGILSDDANDPRSLLLRMRSAVGAERLPFRVAVSDRLAALAATGDGVILVGSGRWLEPNTIERTVLHEVFGHALPRALSRSRALGLFRIGSAGGSDDQEGRAIRIEERSGLLGPGRRRELARRHLACRSVEGQRDFVTTVNALLMLDTPLPTALRIAARAHRGGGLGREAVYLPSYLRVTDALEASPSLDEVLAHGRVAVTLAPLAQLWVGVSVSA